MSGPSRAALSAATFVAAVVGAVTGVVLNGPAWTPGVPILLISLGVIVTSGIGLVDLWLPRDDATRNRLRHATLLSPLGPLETSTSSPDQPHQDPSLVDEYVSVAHPVPSDQWWDRGAPARRSPAVNSTRPEPVIGVDDSLEASIIAQCPNCGGFRLDVEPAPPGYHFRCMACVNRWSWYPGEPWPVVQIDPRRRVSRRPTRMTMNKER